MTRLAAALLAGLAVPASAHDGIEHGSQAEALAHTAVDAAPTPGGTPLPFDLGGPFTLTDQTGRSRSEADPDGAMQLLFFGYANCPSICATALPLMAEVTDRLRARGIAVTPVMITVDPDRDTVTTIGPPLAAHHPDFVGLTGSAAELAPVYDLFAIEASVAFVDPEHGPIFAHGSHIFLLDGAGTVLTLLPPILSVDRIAEIAEGYAGG